MNEILPVIPADGFETLRDLLSLVSNEKKAMRLLNALEDKLTKVAEAESKLSAEREEFERVSRRKRGELEDKAAKLRAKELALIGREAIADRTLERERSDRLDRARLLSAAATISQERP